MTQRTPVGHGDDAQPLVVLGTTLAGMAAAARLAKAGHHVVLVGSILGGHWRDDLPPVVRLPATWKDLFKKSGRALDAEFGRAGLAWAEAPPSLICFASGREFRLPTERAAQWHAIKAVYGEADAQRWLDLGDRLDEVWQDRRAHGLERPAPPPPRRNWLARRRDLSIDDLADRAPNPDLAEWVRCQARLAGTDRLRTAPSVLATALSVDRIFGRWTLTRAGVPVPATQLIELLADRLTARGVRLAETAPAPPVLDARVPKLAGARYATAPRVRRSDAGSPDVQEIVDLSGLAPVISWTTPSGSIVHDYRQARPDRAWGLAPDTTDAWLRRPGLGASPAWRASAASPAGNEPWAELASAALAVYEIHEHLTGADIRPGNRSV